MSTFFAGTERSTDGMFRAVIRTGFYSTEERALAASLKMLGAIDKAVRAPKDIGIDGKSPAQ